MNMQLCDLLNPVKDDGGGLSAPSSVVNDANLTTVNTTGSMGIHTTEESWDLEMVSHWIIIPSLCVMGLLGNSLTFIVLLYRLNEKVEMIEKGSIIGMAALAVTDCAFCLVTLYGTFAKDTNMIYRSRSLLLYFKLYGNYVQNVLIKTSTFITMIMALYRLMAVVYAINARNFLKPIFPFAGICIGFAFWALFQLPLIWIWEVLELECSPHLTYILLEVGRFEANNLLRQCMTYAWAVLGFFVPVSVLAYCNVKLIIQVHVSSKQTSQSQRSRQSKRQNMQLKMTTTLIAIIVCFFLFVFPGELLHFYQDVSTEMSISLHILEAAIEVSNMLLSLNMSFNFILYCIVNTQFRKTLVVLLYKITCKKSNTKSRALYKEQSNSLIKNTVETDF